MVVFFMPQAYSIRRLFGVHTGSPMCGKLNEIVENLVGDGVGAEVLDDSELRHKTSALAKRYQGKVRPPPGVSGTRIMHLVAVREPIEADGSHQRRPGHLPQHSGTRRQ